MASMAVNELGPMLTATEVAEMLHLHVNTVKRLGDRGELPFYRVCKRGDRRFRLDDVMKSSPRTASLHRGRCLGRRPRPPARHSSARLARRAPLGVRRVSRTGAYARDASTYAQVRSSRWEMYVNELEPNLLTGEQVVFETKKHWFAPIRASLVAILIILGALVLRWLAPTGDGFFGSIGNLMDLIAIGLLLFAILWIAYNIAEFLSAHFGVTNMRVLRYEGLLRRRSSETLLPMLTDVRLDEPALGRMLGFGNLKILTASGAAGEDRFMTVAKAKELRTAIQEQKAASMTGKTPPLPRRQSGPPRSRRRRLLRRVLPRRPRPLPPKRPRPSPRLTPSSRKASSRTRNTRPSDRRSSAGSDASKSRVDQSRGTDARLSPKISTPSAISAAVTLSGAIQRTT